MQADKATPLESTLMKLEALIELEGGRLTRRELIEAVQSAMPGDSVDMTLVAEEVVERLKEQGSRPREKDPESRVYSYCLGYAKVINQ